MTETTPAYLPKSLRAVASRRSGGRVATVFIALVVLTAAVLTFVPWQQTIIAPGQVSIYNTMDRPQNIEAQIPGRLVAWFVQEGETVKAGDTIAKLQDIDSKFLDPNQAKRLTEQTAALREQKARVVARISRLDAQLSNLEQSQDLAIRTSRQRLGQAKSRRENAAQSLVQAQKAYRIADEVAQASASERVLQLSDAIRQAEQSVIMARQDLETARIQRERVAELYRLDLRSKRDDELAQNDLVGKGVRVKQAEDALKIAQRAKNLGNLSQTQVGIERERASAAVVSAEAALSVADRDISTSVLDLSKVGTDTAATLASLEASRESARESLAKFDEGLAKIAVERRNLSGRIAQQIVKSPRDGRVVRAEKVGAGETVKAGDTLATILPDTTDQAVELFVTDNDAPLLATGRRVRLQFAGWPAVQFTGFPSVAVGTFGGRVRVIDAVDDGTARYRVIVEPDYAGIQAGKEERWPTPNLLRPGGEATGWILLDTVPLGWELWRQFNAFPPTVKRPPVGESGEKDGDKPKDGKKEPGYIKLKTK
ncbi:MAG: HlyD family efflux transporter periplasmic adaptor subunit [Armatimonadetes bacterium]|nr:HlyD family efflux transporter periplasmic adaptor subunit [Armatimonadota bacterium]